MKHIVKAFFDFSKQDKIGLSILLGVLLVIGMLRLFEPWVRVQNRRVFEQVAPAEQMLIELLARFDSVRQAKAEGKHLQPVHFDPNTLSAEGWISMGIEPVLAERIVNYTEKGGRFYRKDELKKIYGLTDVEYQVLAPFIHIKKKEKQYFREKKPESFTGKIEINGASSEELTKLKGIGNYYAKKIIAFREKLGGFYKPEQLLEVYGMDSSRYDMFKEQLELNTALIRKININEADFESLRKHPYISYSLALSWIRYREENGFYHSVNALLSLHLMDKKTLDKLRPYLVI